MYLLSNWSILIHLLIGKVWPRSWKETEKERVSMLLPKPEGPQLADVPSVRSGSVDLNYVSMVSELLALE
jgi:hypothetical protein